MKTHRPMRRILAACAALVLCAAYSPVPAVMAETGEEELTNPPAPTQEAATEPAPEKLSTITVVHTAEITDEDYRPTEWWKAGLEDYEDFSLVSYETVSSFNENDLIAEGRDDTIISNTMTESAVTYTDPGTFAFTSYGWGHCVGLSQNGANFYAKYAGWNYRDILFHYYPGTTLRNTGTAESETVTTQGVPGSVLQQVAEIVNCEVGPSFEPECIKAQAVATYTYMKYHNNDAHDLKGKPNPPRDLVQLCADVLGEALYYNGEFCLTMFYASCGGITANCSDIFVADLPYLRSVASEYDSQYDPHWGDVKYYSVEEVRSRIQNAYHITLSNNPENWIKIVEGNGGYANKVIVDDQITVRGNAFRSVMGLKSPKFTYICNIGQASAPPAAEEEPAPAQPEEPPAPADDGAEGTPSGEMAPPPMPSVDADLSAPPVPSF